MNFTWIPITVKRVALIMTNEVWINYKLLLLVGLYKLQMVYSK